LRKEHFAAAINLAVINEAQFAFRQML